MTARSGRSRAPWVPTSKVSRGIHPSEVCRRCSQRESCVARLFKFAVLGPTLSLGGTQTLKNECSRALARALGLYRRPPDPLPHRLYRRSQHRPWNHQKQPSPSSPVAPDAALGTACGYGQSTPRELQLSYPATLSSAKLRATSTGPDAQAPAAPAIPLARTGSGCVCAAPPSSLRTGRVGE